MKKCKNYEHCENTFTGRSNKDFCSSMCKSNFHNKKNRDPELPENKTKKILHNNYKILKHFWGYHRRFCSRLPLELLLSEGYDTSVYTVTTLHPVSKWRIRWVYDLGLVFNENTNFYQLLQRDEYGRILL